METYLNMGIKEIINQFPEVEKTLNDFKIGCAPCNVGTCLLKDIVAIHNLSENEEKEMMARLSKNVYPDKVI